MLTLRTSTSNKSDEFGGTLEGTPCYTNTQHFQISEEQMNQLLIAICKGGKGGQHGDYYKRSFNQQIIIMIISCEADITSL